LHFTPTGSSWLNHVERRFAWPADKQIKHGAHHSGHDLKADIAAFTSKPTTTIQNASSGPGLPMTPSR
jgi:hypothetical protein